MTKPTKFSLAALAILALGLTACAATFSTGAAVVNGVKISQEAVDGQVTSAATGGGTGDTAQAAREVLSRLIQDELIKQEADRREVSLSETEIDDQLEQIKAQFPSEADFQQALDVRGLTIASLRDQISSRARADALAEAIAGPVTDDQVRSVYETQSQDFQERDVRHILIEVQDQSRDAAARTEAEALKKRIQDGASFAALAKEFSDDTGSAKDGGSIGTINASSQLVPEFLDASLRAKKGEIVGPVRTQFGYHLIRVDSIKSQSFAEVAEQIRAQLQQQVTQTALGRFLADAAAKASIQVNPRYGQWDPEQQAVVPAEFFEPPPQTDADQPDPIIPPGFQPPG